MRRQANAVLKEGHRIVAKNLRCMRRVGRALCSAAALSAQSPEPLACRRSRRRAGPTSKPAGKKKKPKDVRPGVVQRSFNFGDGGRCGVEASERNTKPRLGWKGPGVAMQKCGARAAGSGQGKRQGNRVGQARSLGSGSGTMSVRA